MQPVVKPIVTFVRKQRPRSYQTNPRKATQVIHVTRIKSFRLNATKKTEDVTPTAEHFQMSSTNSDDFPTDLSVQKSVKSTSILSIVKNYSLNLVSKKQLIDDSDNQHLTASSQTGATKDVKRIQSSLSFTPSSKKITPLNDYNSSDAILNSTRSQNSFYINSSPTVERTITTSKSFRFHTGDLRDLHTNDKQSLNAKRKNKLCQPHLLARCCILSVLLVLLVVGIIMAPIALLVLKTTTVSVTTSTTSTTASSTTLTTASTTTVSTTTATTTIPAATVTITSNICTSNWSAIEMVANCINCTFFPAYFQYTRNYTSLSTSSVIAFSIRRQTGYFALDNISVQSFSAPGVEILNNGGFETGSLTSWSYCNQNNGSNTGGVKANSSSFTYLGFTYYAKSGSYYYVGGSTTSADYISQTFPTVFSAQYTVSMWVMNAGTGPLTSADLFLGV